MALKTALITGGSRGIGAGVARALARDGWRVVLSGRADSEKGRETASALGATFLPADLREEAQVQQLFTAAGEIDALICCAGVAHYGLLQDMTDAQWRDVFSVNTDGVFRCCRAAIPGMVRKKSGCIVTVSSVWGEHGASCEAAYSASKAAVIGLTKALAKELGPSGIRVNCVAPGVIDTDMVQVLGEETLQDLANQTPLGRLGTPEDIAEAMAYLADATFVTGQILPVNGGIVL